MVVFTDGVSNAGRRAGCPLEPLEALTMGGSASDIAEGLLAAAIDADQGRPGDDMAVVALAINAAEDVQPIRTMRVTWPIPE
ncbi:MAG TPA: hypothetical protein DEU95_03425 [Chloroflexi bacterium]|nr:hypothetical protein [Chloroflexota bacterium]